MPDSLIDTVRMAAVGLPFSYEFLGDLELAEQRLYDTEWAATQFVAAECLRAVGEPEMTLAEFKRCFSALGLAVDGTDAVPEKAALVAAIQLDSIQSLRAHWEGGYKGLAKALIALTVGDGTISPQEQRMLPMLLTVLGGDAAVADYESVVQSISTHPA
jgi:hypothetical protein